MVKDFKLNEAVASSGDRRAMETRDHSNGVSPKNHRSRGNFLMQVLVILCLCGVVGCTKDSNNSKKWVLINGVKWATCNVGSSGVFAATPESAGFYYKWDELANPDPSPSGYRVPTKEELESLLNEAYVTHTEMTQNGVNGWQFTDKQTGGSIFLPVAGYRDPADGTLDGVGRFGNYWSCTQQDVNRAWYLDLPWESRGTGPWVISSRKTMGFSVRPVAE